MEYLVFTYGTLMRGQINHHYVENAEYAGEGVLYDYGLLEHEDGYPCAVRREGFRVYGELYKVDEQMKAEMDVLEDVGVLYDCKEVQIDKTGESVKALFYEFIPDGVERKIRLPLGKWDPEKRNVEDYVWYAVYGSNLLDARFNIYIDGTTSKAQPLMQVAYEIKHPLYFAKHAEKWQDKGVAFVDLDQEGRSYSWRYLISKEQFKQISGKEGAWYKDKLLETDVWGIPIRTLTSPSRYAEVEPDDTYLEVIGAGLLEKRLVMTAAEAEKYLGKEGLDFSREHISRILEDL